MSHFVFWRLASDVLLLAALGYLCLQFVRSPRLNSATRQLRELESALRGLIKDADVAGRSLNDQLLRRQQSLEKLLIDAQLAEQRIEQAVSDSSARGAQVSRAEHAVPTRERVAEAPAARPQPAAEPASFTRAAAVETVIDDEAESEITFGNTNIYGEPIPPPAAAKSPPPQQMGRAMRRAMQTYSPLQSQIEKEIEAKPVAQPKTSGIEDVYAAAEELLRAGNDLAAVSGRTKLPIEEVRALSQMIIGERNVAQASGNPIDDADPRLGVMANMKRQTITL